MGSDSDQGKGATWLGRRVRWRDEASYYSFCFSLRGLKTVVRVLNCSSAGL